MIKKEVIGLLLILLLILTPLKPLKAEEKNMLPEKILIHKDQKKSEGEKKKDKGDSYYSLGVFAYKSGNFNKAEENFLKALELDPDNPSFNHYMGKTYIEMKRYKEEFH